MSADKDEVKRAIEIVSQAFSDQDYGTALTLLKPLADAGVAEAIGMLGLAYKIGAGLQADGIKAVELLQKAVEMGDAIAAYNLGLLYRDGAVNVEQNEEISRSYLQLAREMGAEIEKFE